MKQEHALTLTVKTLEKLISIPELAKQTGIVRLELGKVVSFDDYLIKNKAA